MHHRRTHIWMHILLIAVMALGAAACGGGDASSSTSTSAPAPSTSTPAPDAGSSLASTGGTPAAGATGAASGSTPASSATLPPPASGDSDLGAALGNISGAMFAPKAKMTETSTDTSSSTGGTTTTTDGTTTGTDTSSTTSSTTYTGGSTAKTYMTAKVSVNGKTYTLTQNAVFPSDTQQFVLKKLYADSIIIELTAGQFSGGAYGMTLDQGVKAKFVNQDTGVTYTLKLIETS